MTDAAHTVADDRGATLSTDPRDDLRAAVDEIRDLIPTDSDPADDTDNQVGYRNAIEHVLQILDPVLLAYREREGWQWVPVEPTQEMLEASWQTCINLPPSDYMATALAAPRDAHMVKARSRYAAMLVASPSPTNPKD